MKDMIKVSDIWRWSCSPFTNTDIYIMSYFWMMRVNFNSVWPSLHVREDLMNEYDTKVTGWSLSLTELQRTACGFTAGMASFCFAVLILLNILICYPVSCLMTPPSSFISPRITLKTSSNQTSGFISRPTSVCIHVVLTPFHLSGHQCCFFCVVFLAGTCCFIPKSRWECEANSLNMHINVEWRSGQTQQIVHM